MVLAGSGQLLIRLWKQLKLVEDVFFSRVLKNEKGKNYDERNVIFQKEKKNFYLWVLLLKEVNSGSLLTNNWMTHTEKR